MRVFRCPSPLRRKQVYVAMESDQRRGKLGGDRSVEQSPQSRALRAASWRRALASIAWPSEASDKRVTFAWA
jgi:hypothetical protein